MAREPEWLLWRSESSVAQMGKTNKVRPDRRLVNLYTELRLIQSKLLDIFKSHLLTTKLGKGNRCLVFNSIR